MRLFTRRKAAAVVAAIAVLGGAVAAYAYWTGGGSGTGSASASSATQAITVTQTTSVTGLYPGATPVTLAGKFNNPNSGPVYVHNVTGAVHNFSSQTDATKPACTQADFSVAGSATVDAEVPAGTAVGSWSGLTLQLTDTSANQDNCKGASVTVDYTANAT